MAFSKSYRDFVVEQLKRIAPVTAKSVFGGVGLYTQGRFFALIAEDRLYFKVDDTTRPDFERLGMEPFRPFGEENAMGYSGSWRQALRSGAGSSRMKHLFHTLVETVHWHKSRIWKAPYNLAREFHVYGLEWDPEVRRFTVDGTVVREERNTHWHQPLALCSRRWSESVRVPQWEAVSEAALLQVMGAAVSLSGRPRK